MPVHGRSARAAAQRSCAAGRDARARELHRRGRTVALAGGQGWLQSAGSTRQRRPLSLLRLLPQRASALLSGRLAQAEAEAGRRGSGRRGSGRRGSWRRCADRAEPVALGHGVERRREAQEVEGLRGSDETRESAGGHAREPKWRGERAQLRGAQGLSRRTCAHPVAPVAAEQVPRPQADGALVVVLDALELRRGRRRAQARARGGPGMRRWRVRGSGEVQSVGSREQGTGPKRGLSLEPDRSQGRTGQLEHTGGGTDERRARPRARASATLLTQLTQSRSALALSSAASAAYSPVALSVV